MKTNKTILQTLTALWSCIALSTIAMENANIKTLSEKQTEAILLKQEIETAKLKQDLLNAAVEKNRIQQSLNAQIEQLKAALEKKQLEQALSAGPDGSLQVNGDPLIQAIYGRGTALFAVFLMPNGGTIEAKAGDTLVGDYTVSRITQHKVELTKKGKRIEPAFVSNAPSTKDGASMGGRSNYTRMQ